MQASTILTQGGTFEQEPIKLMALLDIDERCASDVAYLRTRSRHSQELENKLITLHKAGTPPKISEFC